MRVALFVVFVSVLTTVGGFKFLHEQDRSPTAFWFGPHLLAWQGSLLGRDTDRATWSDPQVRQKDHLDTVQQTVQRKIDRPNWHDAMSEMLPNEEPVRSPWVDRWIDIEPSPIVSRWVDIAQVGPPRIIRRPEPMVTSRGVVITGQAAIKSKAVAAAEKAIDRALAAKRVRLVPPDDND